MPRIAALLASCRVSESRGARRQALIRSDPIPSEPQLVQLPDVVPQGVINAPPETPSLPHHAALDGLRGLAVALVVIAAAGASWLPGGFLGISVFFTLSGFLITRKLLAEYDDAGTVDLPAFWAGRIKRLWPALLACLAGVVVFSVVLGSAAQRTALRGDVWSSVVGLANWHFLWSGADYSLALPAPSPLQHFWAIAIGEQFLLLFPLLLLLALGRLRPSRRRGRTNPRWSLLVAALLAGIVASTAAALLLAHGSRSWNRAYLGSDTRAAELLVGCLIAVLVHRQSAIARLPRRILTPAALISVGALAWMWSELTPRDASLYKGGLLIHAGLVGVVILACVGPRGPVHVVLEQRPLRALGRVSLAVYLFYWPVFLWLTPRNTELEGGWLVAAKLGLTLVLAAACYRFVETPIRRPRDGSSLNQVLTFPAATVAVCIAAFLLTWNQPAGSAAEIWLRSAIDGDPAHVVSGPLPASPLGRPVRVAVAGDSLGYQIYYALELWVTQAPGPVDLGYTSAVPGCGLVATGHLRPRDAAVVKGLGRKCRAVSDRNTVIRATDPDVVLVVSGVADVADRRLPGEKHYRRPGDPVFDNFLVDQYRQQIKILTAAGAKIVWAEWPCVSPTPHLIDGGPPPSGFKQDRLQYLNQQILPRVAAAEPTKVRLVDLGRSLCAGGRYQRSDSNGKVLRTVDGLHLSSLGARRVRDQLIPDILAAAQPVRPARPRR